MGGCRESPGSFAEWENSCEKADLPPPPPLNSSPTPAQRRFSRHQPGKLIALPRLGSWKTPSTTNQNQVYLLCHRSFCEKHRPTQNIQGGSVGEESCVLCCEDLSQASVENIQSPCCSQTIYHRKCIQVGTFSALGTFHNCPSSEHPGNAQAISAGGLCAGWFQAVRGKSAQSLVTLDL